LFIFIDYLERITGRDKLSLIFRSFLRNLFKIFIGCIALSIYSSTNKIDAQILQDTASLNLIKNGVDSIYNMQFNYSKEVYRKISKAYPDHPVVIVYKGIITYWENYPLTPSSAASTSFEEEMLRCIKLCEKNNNSSFESEYLLANLCARGLLLTFYSDNDIKNEVFPLAKSTYHYIRRSFDFTPGYSDFFFFTGLYNYYREVYPRVHPVYRPLALLFPNGNREKGLEEIQTAAQNSILFKAESYSYLSYIYITYENNYPQAIYFSKYLHDLYPLNPDFLADYIQNLLLIKKYDEAETLVGASGKHEKNTFFNAQLSVFKGIIQEKKYKNNKLAQQYYNTGIRDLSAFGAYGNEFAAYAYFGLSRISGAIGDKDNKKNYHKQAMKLADSKKINFD
jgi:hypothetical protein